MNIPIKNITLRFVKEVNIHPLNPETRYIMQEMKWYGWTDLKYDWSGIHGCYIPYSDTDKNSLLASVVRRYFRTKIEYLNIEYRPDLERIINQ